MIDKSLLEVFEKIAQYLDVDETKKKIKQYVPSCNIEEIQATIKAYIENFNVLEEADYDSNEDVARLLSKIEDTADVMLQSLKGGVLNKHEAIIFVVNAYTLKESTPNKELNKIDKESKTSMSEEEQLESRLRKLQRKMAGLQRDKKTEEPKKEAHPSPILRIASLEKSIDEIKSEQAVNEKLNEYITQTLSNYQTLQNSTRSH